MKIVFFSDTHGKHHQLIVPEGDMIICCGDISMRGDRSEIRSFLDWFSDLPHKYKIFISGNHDFWFDTKHSRNKSLRPGENPRDIIPSNIIYLENETITIEGIKIFGSPWTPWFHSWAFNATRGDEINKNWELIEEGTDIVIAHGPPAGTHLDRCRGGDRVGCQDLAKRLAVIKPKICSFGHIHEAYGVDDKEILDINDPSKPGDMMKLINCSVLNLQYEVANRPITINWSELI
jgi:predicted phosphohydrolase